MDVLMTEILFIQAADLTTGEAETAAHVHWERLATCLGDACSLA